MWKKTLTANSYASSRTLCHSWWVFHYSIPRAKQNAFIHWQRGRHDCQKHEMFSALYRSTTTERKKKNTPSLAHPRKYTGKVRRQCNGLTFTCMQKERNKCILFLLLVHHWMCSKLEICKVYLNPLFCYSTCNRIFL